MSVCLNVCMSIIIKLVCLCVRISCVSYNNTYMSVYILYSIIKLVCLSVYIFSLIIKLVSVCTLSPITALVCLYVCVYFISYSRPCMSVCLSVCLCVRCLLYYSSHLLPVFLHRVPWRLRRAGVPTWVTCTPRVKGKDMAR